MIKTGILTLLCAIGLATGVGAQNAGMKVLAFADDNGVRIDVATRSASGELKAVIVPVEGGSPLWTGNLATTTADAEGVFRSSTPVDGLRPRLWSPESPTLYRLEVTGVQGEKAAVRFGFRSFTTEDGVLYLNNKPIFLRGNAINPPERNIPDHLEEDRTFVSDYVRGLKDAGVNIIRLTRHSQVWFDVCDELGMMIYQGNYGTPKGATAHTAPNVPLAETVKYFKEEVFEPLVNHPCVVIYVLSNEQASEDISYMRRGAEEVDAYLTAVFQALKPWDPTRLYIGNAGYGLGRAGDICDTHRYWGWYYNSFLSFYTLRNSESFWRNGMQPITLTENTGNYTGPDGRFNLVSKTKQPESQLNWTGHAPDSEQSQRAMAHQAFVAKQAIEISRRVRSVNKRITGLMPFTIPFKRWYDVEKFADMQPKPVMDQYAVSYQPILLSWEMWNAQAYAGATVRPIVHVVNDSESREDLTGLKVAWRIVDKAGKTRVNGEIPFPDVRYYEARSVTLAIALPEALGSGTYTLEGSVVRNGAVLSVNSTPLFTATRAYATAAPEADRRVVVYDPSGLTVAALEKAGRPFSRISNFDRLNPGRMLVIGSKAWDSTARAGQEALKTFVQKGGRVVVLDQDAATFDVGWLPVRVTMQTAELDHAEFYPGGRPFRNGISINPERPDHPVFAGISRDRLHLWSDYTEWNQTRPGFPSVYPVTQGFVLDDKENFAGVSVLANYDHGLEGIAMAEFFAGKGSVLLSGFDIVPRSGLDPVADRMLGNLISYAGSKTEHRAHPLIDSKIIWGDYASERGILTGIYSGFLLHTVPLVPDAMKPKYPIRIDDGGFHFAGAGAGWNSSPSIQYEGKGRRAYGPYRFSLGGSVQLPPDAAEEGRARFWIDVPNGRKEMTSKIWNPSNRPLTLKTDINGSAETCLVPAGQTTTCTQPILRYRNTLGITYSGDRRLVILETDFR